MSDDLPELKPCPICGNTDLYTGPMSCDSQGVHCMNIGDSIVGIVLMANRKNKKAQQEFLESPQLRGCGLKISREYPSEYPKDLQGKPFDEAQPELQRRTLLEAIRVWNTRVET